MRWNTDYLLRRIAEEYVLLPVAGEAAKESRILAINQTAGEICELILQGCDKDGIVDALLECYDADRAVLAADVTQTLQYLQALHVVTE